MSVIIACLIYLGIAAVTAYLIVLGLRRNRARKEFMELWEDTDE